MSTYLTGYEGNDFTSTGNFEDDHKHITAAHHVRVDAVKGLMVKTKTTDNELENLTGENKVKEIDY